MPLEKAKLTEIEDLDGGSTRVSGPEIAVQFNPASLKLSFTNKIETQETKGQQTRQFIGMSSTSLSFDLEFDTSDEGATDAPVSVRTRTAAIERFLLPKGDGKEKQKPPKARFSWNETVVDGIIDSLGIDLTHFASDGTPLRAKMSVTMQEQNAKYQSGKTGPGANRANGARPPGGGGTGPGSVGGGIGFSASASASIGLSASAGISGGFSAGASITDSTRMAFAGESAAEFATRNGLDPAAWRGVAGAGGSSLALSGGAEVNFNSSISAGGGVGVAVGVETGANASPEAKIGLDARGAVPTAAGLALGGTASSAGFALASAGGVRAAMETVNAQKSSAAATNSRASFGTGAATTPASVDQSRVPLRQSGLPSASAQATTPSAPAPPTADARANTFGFGVPLRPLVNGAAAARKDALGGAIPLRPNERATDPLAPSSDPTAAPWTHLPASRSQQKADAVQRSRRPARACGCHGPCTHRSG